MFSLLKNNIKNPQILNIINLIHDNNCLIKTCERKKDTYYFTIIKDTKIIKFNSSQKLNTLIKKIVIVKEEKKQLDQKTILEIYDINKIKAELNCLGWVTDQNNGLEIGKKDNKYIIEKYYSPGIIFNEKQYKIGFRIMMTQGKKKVLLNSFKHITLLLNYLKYLS